jgi:pimeloyl-ACP methyl ester carboxylesterase
MEPMAPHISQIGVVALGWLAELFSQSELHAVEGASHWPQWERPEIVAKMLFEFLAK